MVDPQVLATVPLFASLDTAELSQIAPWFERRSVSPGTRLVGQGASGYTFFILTGGGAAVVIDDAPVAQLGPGDFFGQAQPGVAAAIEEVDKQRHAAAQ